MLADHKHTLDTIFLTLKNECYHTPRQIQNHTSRISDPLIDRISIHAEVPNLQYKDLTSTSNSESPEEIREKVTETRIVQL